MNYATTPYGLDWFNILVLFIAKAVIHTIPPVSF